MIIESPGMFISLFLVLESPGKPFSPEVGGGGGGILEGFEWKQNILIKDIKHFEFFVLGSTKVFGNIYFMICAEKVFS